MRKIFSGRRGSREPFQFRVNVGITSATSGAAGTFRLPLNQASLPIQINFMVDWGDGSAFEQIAYPNAGTAVHTYTNTGTYPDYTIKIYGNVRGWSFGIMGSGEDDACKVIQIENWGRYIATEPQGWKGCTELTGITAPDYPDMSENGTCGFSMFYGCLKLRLISNINDWNVQPLTSAVNMFRDCGVLAVGGSGGGSSGSAMDLSGWDVSKLQACDSMFNSCLAFNAAMFKLTIVTNMQFMFYNCRIFNDANSGQIGQWDVSLVQTFNGVFFDAVSFNQDISGWNTSNVTNMNYCFFRSSGGGTFNQPIGNWDISNVTTMAGFLYNQTAFNQNLTNWDFRGLTTVATFTNSPVASVGMTLSLINYDAALQAWDALGSYPSMPAGSTLSFGQSQYSAAPSAAATAHANLVTKWGGISDGGPI